MRTMLTTRMPASAEAMAIRKFLEDLAACSLHLDEHRRADGQTRRRMVVRKLRGISPPYPVYEFGIGPETGFRIRSKSDTPLSLTTRDGNRPGKIPVKTAPRLFSENKLIRQNVVDVRSPPAPVRHTGDGPKEEPATKTQEPATKTQEDVTKASDFQDTDPSRSKPSGFSFNIG